MTRALRFARGLVLLPALASAYPLYWIGTQIHGNSFVWQYSGKASNGVVWSSVHASSAGVRAAISASFQDLTAGVPKDQTNAACSTLVLTENTPAGGSNRRLNDTDGVNVEGVVVTSPSDPIYQYMQGGTVAFAAPAPDSLGYVQDCDTVFNAVDTSAFILATDGTTGTPDRIDVQTISQQETAHCFGMHHTCEQSPGDGMPKCNLAGVDTTSIMYPFARNGPQAQHPNPRDQDNLCQIYPVNGIGKPCDPQNGQTQTGFLAPDCQGGTTCDCTSVGKICTQACGGGAACPAKSACDGSGHCIPNFYPGSLSTQPQVRTAVACGGADGGGGGGGGANAAVSSACASNEACGTGMVCLSQAAGGYCTLACAGTTCPNGSACFHDVLATGDAYCLKLCTLATPVCSSASCRTGLACQYTGSDINGACWRSCAVDADCDPAVPPGQRCDAATGLCYSAGAAPVCSGSARTDCSSVPCTGGLVCDAASGACVEPGSIPDGGAKPDAGHVVSLPTVRCVDAAGVAIPSCVATEGTGCGCGSAPMGAWAVLALSGLLSRRRAARPRTPGSSWAE